MATITVRQLEESTREALQRLAQRNGRSMEAEVRDILTRAVMSSRPFSTLATRAQEAGGEMLERPESDTEPRVDFGDRAFG